MPSSSDAKRARILEAAYQLCLGRGVEATRMEEVAARAQVSKGTLYRYFESKEELLLATILDSYEQSLRLLPHLPEVGSLDAQGLLSAHVDALVKVLESLSPRMNVHYQAWSLVAKTPALKEKLDAFLRDFHVERGAELVEVIEAGQQQAVFRRDLPAAALAEGMQALLSGFLYRASFDPDAASPPLLRQCFDAILHDLVSPPTAPDRAGPRA